MSNSKQIIDALIQEDLYTAKKLISEDLVARMGNALENKLVDFGPTLFGEGAKPDFLDLDGDGNKTESMKQAAKGKNKKKIKEDKHEGDEDDDDGDDDDKKKKKKFNFFKKKMKKTNEDVESEEDRFEAELKSLVEEIEEETGEELSEEEITDIGNMLLDMINEDDSADEDDEDEDEEDETPPVAKLQKPNVKNAGRMNSGSEDY